MASSSSSWRRFASPYYIANVALVATYVALRVGFQASDPSAPGRKGRINTLEQLQAWERQAVVALGAVVAFRVWRRRSWDHAAADALFYAKVVAAAVATMVDPRLAAWYGLACWAIYALLPQPIIDLASTGTVEALTPTTLREASAANDCAWLVFFHTQSHGASVAAAPAFLEVAEEFASPKLKFGSFDVCVWPRTAAELKLTSNTWSNQLPAVVLFERGKEWGRLPPASVANDPSKRNYYTRKDIVRLFRLEERFARPLEGAAAAAAGGGGGSKKRQ